MAILPSYSGAADERRFVSPLLQQRLRVGLWLILAATVLLPLIEIVAPAAPARWEVLAVQAVLVTIVLLRLARPEEETRVEALLTLAAVCVAITAISVLTGNTTLGLVLLTLLPMVTATLFPWGMLQQVLFAGMAASSLAAIASLVAPLVRPDPTAQAAAGFALLVSIYITYELNRTRAYAEEEDAERRRTEQALRLVEAAVEQANDAIVVMTPEIEPPGPSIVYVNPAFTAMTGFSAEEASGKPLRALFGPGTHTDVVTRLREALKSNEPAIGQGTCHRKDGSPYILEWHAAPIRDAQGKVIHRVTINRDVTERVRAEEGRAALLQINREISGRLEPGEIRERVQQNLAALLPCEQVATLVWDEASGVLRPVALYGFDESITAKAAEFEYRPGDALRRDMLAGKTMVITNPNNQPWIPAYALTQLEINAAVATPLTARGQTLGLLAVGNTSLGRQFDTVQVQLFEGIARQVAIAIDAAELYRSQREDVRVSSALARVGEDMIAVVSEPAMLQRLSQLAADVLECDASHTLLWRAEEEAYVPVSGLGDPAEHWEVLQLMRFSPADFGELLERMEQEDVVELETDGGADGGRVASVFAQSGIVSTLFIPLRRGDDIIGALMAHYRQSQRGFAEWQRRIALGIGHLASMALENARLVSELERANQIKSEFVATISHELRTPMNVVIGYNELLLDGAFGELQPDQAEPLQRSQRSAHELLEMINAILDLNRLDHERIPVDIGRVDAPTLIREVVDECTELKQKPTLQVEPKLAQDLPALHTDQVKLKMILKNLLSNAAKFTDEGKVGISASGRDGGVEFAVSDTGVGITSEAQAVIFDPFRQADGSDTRRFGGLGLGLYIVQRLVQVLGGEISLESKVGEGSTFRVWIPTEAIREAPLRVAEPPATARSARV
ncbi:MAG TPA: ATP-binding protein [Terriglobales bacterium]|nr:ATP-binding protein [Terriglobales bacterium]